ncbi:MAG: heavy-metal-associated domain-containing protein [Anaerolineae bacterium]|nr:heavy-metal-associated domain-containing protein [Anaerolineae bacterium]
MTKTTLRSNELSCPSCIAKIEKSLKGVDGVEAAKVHFTTGRIEVQYDESRASVSDLIEAVRSAGYEAKPSAF